MKSTCLFLVLAVTSACAQPHSSSLVNFSHLRHLTEEIVLDGGQVSIVHVYADYPAYQWVGAGDEGIACVDDVARAAIVYLRSYELRGDTASLSRAQSLLRFVMKMQTDDGQSYNFLRSDHSINRDGTTSLKSFGWWSARAVWAMSLGCRVLQNTDSHFARELEQHVRRSLPNVKRLLEKYGATKTMSGFVLPEWLMYESGADATAELMLGLVEFYRFGHDEHVKMYIKKLADGLMRMQDGDVRTFPFGAHRSWQTTWHSWGNSQSFVLAYAGKVLKDTTMVASAEREARAFYSRLLIDGMLKEWDFADPQKKVAYEQIAYGIRPLTLGLLRLYDATGNELYQKMAGLAASWLFGNNVLREVMYDKTTGRCYDGISDSARVNRNSGAESTIEALYTLLEIEQYPLAKKYLWFKKIKGSSQEQLIEGTFRNETGDELTLALNLTTGTLTLHEGKSTR
jgi:hypothetical protein